MGVAVRGRLLNKTREGMMFTSQEYCTTARVLRYLCMVDQAGAVDSLARQTERQEGEWDKLGGLVESCVVPSDLTRNNGMHTYAALVAAGWTPPESAA